MIFRFLVNYIQAQEGSLVSKEFHSSVLSYVFTKDTYQMPSAVVASAKECNSPVRTFFLSFFVIHASCVLSIMKIWASSAKLSNLVYGFGETL